MHKIVGCSHISVLMWRADHPGNIHQTPAVFVYFALEWPVLSRDCPNWPIALSESGEWAEGRRCGGARDPGM